jgi:hypothetical protein
MFKVHGIIKCIAEAKLRKEFSAATKIKGSVYRHMLINRKCQHFFNYLYKNKLKKTIFAELKF